MITRGRKRRLLHTAATQGSEDMARVPGLKNRNGRWTLRVRVPDDIRSTIRKLEISKSFGAVSHAEACRLARLARTDIDQLFTECRMDLRRSPTVELSESELRYLTRAYFHRLESGAPEVPLDPNERRTSEDTNLEDLMAVSQSEVDVSMEQVAISFAKWAKVDVVPGTPAFKTLSQGIRLADIEYHSRQGDRLALQRVQSHNPLFHDISASTPPLSQLTLAKAVGLYKAAPERSRVSAKTRSSDEFRFAALLDLLGRDTLVANIGRDDVRKAQELLLQLPAHAAKKFRGM